MIINGILYLSLLGLIQGLTEFLPISSSGHLVIFQKLFSLSSPGVVIEAILHLGTLTAVCVYYYKDIYKIVVNFVKGIISKTGTNIEYENDFFNLALFIFIGTLPAALFGIFFKDFFENTFKNVKLVYVFLNVTGIILFTTIFSKKKGKLNLTKSLLIGIAQAIAILPGISRSGITIAAGMWLNVEKKEAARFSFLLAVPSILGAVVLSFKDIQYLSLDFKMGLISGFFIAFIFGYLAIKVLLKFVFKNKFFVFGIYCVILGLIGVLFL